MRFERLPEFQTKKDEAGNHLIATIDISNVVINKDKTPEGGKVEPVVFSFPSKEMEFPQYDSSAEVFEACGGEDKFLEIFNDVTAKYATASGKTVIRTASGGTEEEIIAAGLRASKNFTWKVEAKLSAKEKAGKYDELMALVAGGTLTPEQIAERVKALAGA